MSDGDPLDTTVAALKCAAEPTRLRLLLILCHGEFTVGEVCRIVGQSQPRVSRHLRLLSEGGFLDRFRERQCVYYRASARLRSGWSGLVLAQLDPLEPLLRRDRERVAKVIADRGRVAARELLPAESARRRVEPTAAGDACVADLAALVLEEVGPIGVGELLDVGTGSGALLERLARRSPHAVGVDISPPALRLARTRLHGAGLSHCEFHHGDMYALPCEDASFDTVTMDRVLGLAERPEAALAEAVRALRRGGRLIIVEDFDRLDRIEGTHPLGRLRGWLAGAGLAADRLRPCDLAGGHFIVATARRHESAVIRS